jgi:hypothetical protein
VCVLSGCYLTVRYGTHARTHTKISRERESVLLIIKKFHAIKRKRTKIKTTKILSFFLFLRIKFQLKNRKTPPPPPPLPPHLYRNIYLNTFRLFFVFLL